MRGISWRYAAMAAAWAVFSGACAGSDSVTVEPPDPTVSAAGDTNGANGDGAVEEHDEMSGVTDEKPLEADDHDDSGDSHDDDGEDQDDTGSPDGEGEDGHGHAAEGTPTRYDADVAGAAVTIAVEVIGGESVGGHQRVDVELGSVVALTVTADAAEEIHVHGYDIRRSVADGHPAHFAFSAEIPGVFEVELEGSGRLLAQLTVS